MSDDGVDWSVSDDVEGAVAGPVDLLGGSGVGTGMLTIGSGIGIGG